MHLSVYNTQSVLNIELCHALKGKGKEKKVSIVCLSHAQRWVSSGEADRHPVAAQTDAGHPGVWGDTARRGNGSRMEYLLQHKILETLCTLGKATGTEHSLKTEIKDI